jgi:hypothetical protein
MNKLLIGLAALPFMVSIAMAAQPTPLSDTQMDQVTAGTTDIQLINLNTITVGPSLDFHGLNVAWSVNNGPDAATLAAAFALPHPPPSIP